MSVSFVTSCCSATQTLKAASGPSRQVYWFEGNFAMYEANRHERLGAEADQPHRVKYRKMKNGAGR